MFFNVDDEKAINYNKYRRWCPTCFRVYHLKDNPPLHEGRCDRCDSNIEKNPDDDPKKIRDRVFEWYKMFNPILTKFKEGRNLLEVKDEKDIEKISSKVLSILNKESKPFDTLDGTTPTFKI